MFSLYNKLLKNYTQDPRTAPTESRERYEFDAGALPAQPVYLVGRVASSVSSGQFVYMSDSDYQDVPSLFNTTVREYGAVFALCDPLTAGKSIPIGYVEFKPSDTIAIVRLLCPATDVPFGGSVAAATYVLGTDGRPAVSGDSTYPTGVTPFVVGIGLAGDRLLLTKGGFDAVGAGLVGSNAIVTSSTAIAVTGPSSFDRSVTLANGALNVLGRQIYVEADVTMTASGAGTNTVKLRIALAGTNYDLTGTISKTFSGAGSTSFKIRVNGYVQVAGSSGTLRLTSESFETGAAADLANSSISPDLTGSTVVFGIGGASAGTTTLRNLLVKVS